MLRFDRRVAIITGAGQGLGRSYALFLAARGAKVLVNDTAKPDDESPICSAGAVVEEIRSAGGDAHPDTHDVATKEGGMAIVEAAQAIYGRVDILINNAGILRDGAFHNLSYQDIRDVLDVHLGGAFWVTQPTWKVMRAQGYGRIVFTSSVSGLVGNFGQANYGAAKMGVIGLAKVLATEGKKYGIAVNVIAPLAQTAMAEKLVSVDTSNFSPDAVSPAVAYLSHDSCQLQGEVLSAIGGRVARYFIALTSGYYSPELTIEGLAAHVGEATDARRYTEPRSLADEVNEVSAVIHRGSTEGEDKLS